MSGVIDISHRHYRLPPDARPIGRERFVYVEPDGDGAWAIVEISETFSGSFETGLSKSEAIRIALTWVHDCNAEMVITNGRRP